MRLALAALLIGFAASSACAAVAPEPPRELAVPAEAGNTQAMVRLGRWYLAYENVEPARELFERSARRDDLDAMMSLYDLWGLQLRDEPGAEAQARRWLDRAKATLEQPARAGDVAAQLRLAQIWERDVGSYDGCIPWYKAAAARGSSEAMYSLSQHYRLSWGVEEDLVEATAWLKRAAERGHRRAMEELAQRYATGDGVPMDAALAETWASRAKAAPPSDQISANASIWDFPQSPDINGITLVPRYRQ